MWKKEFRSGDLLNLRVQVPLFEHGHCVGSQEGVITVVFDRWNDHHPIVVLPGGQIKMFFDAANLSAQGE